MDTDSRSTIHIRGARVHNLKNINVTIPRNTLTVITGVSGSGKSSLAFDTLYAEGQRRYVESLSSYARQFLERMDKPDVDFIRGISPAMAIQQKNTTHNPRSTVATTTELYDYMRLLFARIGETISPLSGLPVKKDDPSSIVEEILDRYPEKTRFYVLFPVSMEKHKKMREELEMFRKKGFTRILVPDEEMIDLNQEGINLKKWQPGQIRVIADRLAIKKQDDAFRSRFTESVESALFHGHGRCFIQLHQGEELSYSERFERDGIEFVEPTPQMFSFNNPFGACRTCEGFGRVQGIDEDKVIPDPGLSLRSGAIAVFNTPKFSHFLRLLTAIAARHSWPIDTPYNSLSAEFKKVIWYGKEEYPGIHGVFEQIKNEFYKVHMRVFYSRYRGYSRCPECEGYRVRKDALYVKIGKMHIGQLSEMTIGHARSFFDGLTLSVHTQKVGGQILHEIQKRLRYLDEVGLHYITLNRLTSTLSGGEAQRINLANALGSSLIGSLYVLDEPTIGLHPRDNERLIRILNSLRDIGNTVVVVEHDPAMIRAAGHVIDIGPFAGKYGGEVCYSGSYEGLLKSKTLTGKFLSGEKKIPLPQKRRKGNGKEIVIEGCSEHNLKNIDLRLPLGKFVCITGVSGSGKSTLIHHTLYAALKRELSVYHEKVGRFRSLKGLHHIDGVEMVDQTPIGRSSRSNPATYTKAFDGIRHLFSETREARMMGYKPGHFSFNVKGGRCEACEGEGVQTIGMQFLADIELPCEACGGMRFRKDILRTRYRGKNIHDVLEMPVSEAIDFFVDEKQIIQRLQVLEDVGLGYLKLGQSGTTLSGGEAQRIKLARYLSFQDNKRLLYFFDEPTTGLHFEDISKLLDSFNRLMDQGHSVVIIEHNLDIIQSADWVIDIGPEGGFAGGSIVCEGTPETIANHKESLTGICLKEILDRD